MFTSHDSGNESRVNPPFSSSSSPVRHVCDVRGFRGLGPITENKEERREGSPIQRNTRYRIPCCLVIVASYQDYSDLREQGKCTTTSQVSRDHRRIDSPLSPKREEEEEGRTMPPSWSGQPDST